MEFFESSAQLQTLGQSPSDRREGWEVWFSGNHVTWILRESGKLGLMVMTERLSLGLCLLAGVCQRFAPCWTQDGERKLAGDGSKWRLGRKEGKKNKADQQKKCMFSLKLWRKSPKPWNINAKTIGIYFFFSWMSVSHRSLNTLWWRTW